MLKKALMLATFAASGALAQAATYSLIPNSDSTAACNQVGFAGRFSFTRDANANAYRVRFPSSGSQFYVFPSGKNRYVMSINGSWSEHITLDFNTGEFSYNSGRRTLPGHCYGTIGR